MPAALMMGVSTGSLQSIMAQAPAQESVMARLNEILLPYTQTTGQNCALCYAEICDGTITVLNAGGIPPIVRHAEGSTRWLDTAGLPLGVVIDSPRRYPKTSISLNSGDIVIMVSDGVIEVKNTANQMLGFDRFESVVQAGPNNNAAAMLDHLKGEIHAFSGMAELHDDLTLVIIRCKK
jgi:serine phosphatase RsbU (regulator of sigma subunit)